MHDRSTKTISTDIIVSKRKLLYLFFLHHKHLKKCLKKKRIIHRNVFLIVALFFTGSNFII
jgi:hypothetical protein